MRSASAKRRSSPPGPHFNPGNHKHGMMSGQGHAGDMPNLHVPQSGELSVEVLNTAVTLEKGKPNSLFDDDGSSLMIHAKADDYKTDPAGNAGGRIACGVIQPSGSHRAAARRREEKLATARSAPSSRDRAAPTGRTSRVLDANSVQCRSFVATVRPLKRPTSLRSSGSPIFAGLDSSPIGIYRCSCLCSLAGAVDRGVRGGSRMRCPTMASRWSAGRRRALRHWASAPESGNPW